mmetsp:Transcript_11410/g.21630  ORF Transcript_11410/g.21630 Transcript_11410/m.21630 type:complete len:283 (+) Transcript_11410:46-894(+)
MSLLVSFEMLTATLAVACFAYPGCARRVHMPSEATRGTTSGRQGAELNAQKAKSNLLLAFNSNPSVASRGPAPARMAAPIPLPQETLPETGRRETLEEAPPPPETLYSEAMPFLVRQKSLGPVGKYAGDVGFDPLGISDMFDLEWLREAELKHARVSMLAFLGFVFTDFYHLPGFDYSTLDAHDAAVQSGAMSQILLWVGLFEAVSIISIDQMLRGSGREPGDFGLDPFRFGSDPKRLKALQAKEIANGRLAMLAFSGAVTQAVLTGNTFPYVFGDGAIFGS